MFCIRFIREGTYYHVDLECRYLSRFCVSSVFTGLEDVHFIDPDTTQGLHHILETWCNELESEHASVDVTLMSLLFAASRPAARALILALVSGVSLFSPTRPTRSQVSATSPHVWPISIYTDVLFAPVRSSRNNNVPS